MKISKEQNIYKKRNAFLKGKLRSLTYKWAPKNEAFVAARIDRGMYRCCECKKGFHYKQIERDHADPVVPLTGIEYQETGEIDWNKHIPRVFCEVENWSILCSKCHALKTESENFLRTYYRDIERKKNKLKLRKKK